LAALGLSDVVAVIQNVVEPRGRHAGRPLRPYVRPCIPDERWVGCAADAYEGHPYEYPARVMSLPGGCGHDIDTNLEEIDVQLTNINCGINI
jgi:hypothetical protein